MGLRDEDNPPCTWCGKRFRNWKTGACSCGNPQPDDGPVPAPRIPERGIPSCGWVDIEIKSTSSSSGVSFYAESRQFQHGHLLGVVEDTGVIIETGRRYRVTVEELPDSDPQLRMVPWQFGVYA